eukprot:8485-Pelagomonas_calceolata.AAC.3
MDVQGPPATTTPLAEIFGSSCEVRDCIAKHKWAVAVHEGRPDGISAHKAEQRAVDTEHRKRRSSTLTGLSSHICHNMEAKRRITPCKSPDSFAATDPCVTLLQVLQPGARTHTSKTLPGRVRHAHITLLDTSAPVQEPCLQAGTHQSWCGQPPQLRLPYPAPMKQPLS